jgi:hypothetical protein
VKESPQDLKFEARQVALLSLAELGLGSLIHTFQVPLGGHLLSLNQGLILCQSAYAAQNRGRRAVMGSVLRISWATALLKSFSPSGKVLTPMLAIAAQGGLFSSGILLFGPGAWGLALGSLLLALWGIVQPFLFAWILYGKTIFSALGWTLEKLSSVLGLSADWGLRVLLGLILLKGILALMLPWAARGKRSIAFSESLGERGRVLFATRRGETREASFGHMVLSPLFLFSFVLTGAFFFFSQNESWVRVCWLLMRPLATAFIFYYIVRAFSPAAVRRRLYHWIPTLMTLVGESRGILESEPDSPAKV